MKRWIIFIIIAGIFVGIAAAVLQLYLQRDNRTPETPIEDALAVECVLLPSPVVSVSWPANVADSINGLERSKDGMPWEPVAVPVSGGRLYEDDMVENDATYQYRIMENGELLMQSNPITVDRTGCKR